MVISDIQLYEILSTKFGREEARVLTEYVEAKVEKHLNEKTNVFATKEDIFAVKEDIFALKEELLVVKEGLTKDIVVVKQELKKDIADVRLEMREMEVRLTRNIFISVVVQFLAIVGSVLMLLTFHLK